MKNKFLAIDAPPSTITRNVSVVQTVCGVQIVINGQVVARFDDDDDRIIFVGGVSASNTGLDVSIGGRVRYVWDEDKESSRQS